MHLTSGKWIDFMMVPVITFQIWLREFQTDQYTLNAYLQCSLYILK